jgi:RNA polymerase sigma-70 factor (ECF subfamily)
MQLPPRQRVVLLLRDVLGYRAAEAAGILRTSQDSANAALRRARGTLDARLADGRASAPLPDSGIERDLVGRFSDAIQNGDIDGDIDSVIDLLTVDARFTMPPEPIECRGRAAVVAFLERQFARRGDRGYRLVPTRSNGQPAFGCYRQDVRTPIARAHGIMVLTLEGDRICAIIRFTDNSVFPHFGLPRSLRD